jgi:hypothetical protein
MFHLWLRCDIEYIAFSVVVFQVDVSKCLTVPLLLLREVVGAQHDMIVSSK